MSLSADSELTVSPASAKLPATFTFSAMILDPDVATAKKATVGLHLAEGNDLTFTGNIKSVTQEESIGPTAVRVKFSKRVNGSGTGKSSFKVSMRDADGNDIVTTFVGIG